MALRLDRVNQTSSCPAKIALFRSLFRGREDVCPCRFESRKTGKSGYAPAGANEWVRGICEKPRIRCAECSHRQFLPMADEVIRWHLSGHDGDGQPFVAGVSPLLQDDTCFFLAVDFDKAGWRDDTAAFLGTCRRLHVRSVIVQGRPEGAGAQHLSDPVAYRRDRRKDQLLQENGYLVLRFLAEDVGKELDQVLDAIVRALSHRRLASPTTAPLTFVRPPRGGR